MRFVIIARDHEGRDAVQRRLAVREDHLAAIRPYVESGRILVGGAMLDEHGDMIGSVLIVDFADREELDVWLERDPYVTRGVWASIDVRPYRPAVGSWV
jgi:uncharacterized protein